jgi:hypothetical protein
MAGSASTSAVVEPEAVPRAHFIESVEDFLRDKTPDEAIRLLNSTYQQYKLIESKLLQRRANMMTKLPDIKQALKIVNFLIAKRDDDVCVAS